MAGTVNAVMNLRVALNGGDFVAGGGRGGGGAVCFSRGILLHGLVLRFMLAVFIK